MSQSTTEKGVIIVQDERKQAQLPATMPQSESAAILEVIGKAAMNPQVDIEKMERLFAIQQQITARQSETEYNQAMAAAQSEMNGVVRNKVNSHTRSMFADLDAIHAVIKPIYTAHGFSLSFSTSPSEFQGHIKVKCVTRHRGGHNVESEADYPLDIAGSGGKTNKTAIQAMGSTQTYARRYMETMVFNIALRNDNDGNSQAPAAPEFVSEEQAANLQALMDEVAANKAMFLKYMKVESIADILATHYDKAVHALEQKRKKGVTK